VVRMARAMRERDDCLRRDLRLLATPVGRSPTTTSFSSWLLEARLENETRFRLPPSVGLVMGDQSLIADTQSYNPC